MIKLIVSDVDGTLIKNKEEGISEKMFQLIKALKQQGIYFAVASGRQTMNVHRLFAPVEKDIYFISVNGAVISEYQKIHTVNYMPRELALQIVEDIESKDNCEYLADGVYSCYIHPRNEKYTREIVYTIKNTTTITENIREINDNFVKVSAYVSDNRVQEMIQIFKAKWGDQINIAYSGFQWIDMMNTDKSMGLKFLLKDLDIKPSEMMAFGDNFNDIEMLEMAEESYAMDFSEPEVLQAAKHVCSSVETEIEKFLHDLKDKNDGR